ncbi:MAG: hypothetical protein C0442_10740 [Chlorobiaceae bacterium]|nr:hypothetical protein [Chlorobiaceae bacterium]
MIFSPIFFTQGSGEDVSTLGNKKSFEKNLYLFKDLISVLNDTAQKTNTENSASQSLTSITTQAGDPNVLHLSTEELQLTPESTAELANELKNLLGNAIQGTETSVDGNELQVSENNLEALISILQKLFASGNNVDESQSSENIINSIKTAINNGGSVSLLFSIPGNNVSTSLTISQSNEINAEAGKGLILKFNQVNNDELLSANKIISTADGKIGLENQLTNNTSKVNIESNKELNVDSSKKINLTGLDILKNQTQLDVKNEGTKLETKIATNVNANNEEAKNTNDTNAKVNNTSSPSVAKLNYDEISVIKASKPEVKVETNIPTENKSAKPEVKIEANIPTENKSAKPEVKIEANIPTENKSAKPEVKIEANIPTENKSVKPEVKIEASAPKEVKIAALNNEATKNISKPSANEQPIEKPISVSQSDNISKPLAIKTETASVISDQAVEAKISSILNNQQPKNVQADKLFLEEQQTASSIFAKSIKPEAAESKATIENIKSNTTQNIIDAKLTNSNKGNGENSSDKIINNTVVKETSEKVVHPKEKLIDFLLTEKEVNVKVEVKPNFTNNVEEKLAFAKDILFVNSLKTTLKKETQIRSESVSNKVTEKQTELSKPTENILDKKEISTEPKKVEVDLKAKNEVPTKVDDKVTIDNKGAQENKETTLSRSQATSQSGNETNSESKQNNKQPQKESAQKPIESASVEQSKVTQSSTSETMINTNEELNESFQGLKTSDTLLQPKEKLQTFASQLAEIRNVKQSALMDEITKFISRGNNSSVSINLQPAELGAVKIILEVIDNNVKANIQVENESVINTIQNNIESLKSNLLLNGLCLNQVNISLANSEQKSQKQNPTKKKNNFQEELVTDSRTNRLVENKTLGYNTYEYLV